MSDLSALIEKLSAATEGDRNFDMMIHRVVTCGVTGAYGQHPHYTTSIDAALSLVPEGWDWLVDNSAQVTLFAADSGVPPLDQGKQDTHGWARTAPLAICIAALRAREAAHD